MATQIERQYNTPEYEGRRALDLTEFDNLDIELATIAELDNFLATATINDIQARFADGSLNSKTLVSYYIDRIIKYDVDGYNSVLELNPDALVIAREIDSGRNGSQGALYGIPVLLKDNIGTGDKMHTTAGAKALENSHCDRDAFLVSQLRDAGAIILGKCNLSEWANFMSFESSNGFTVLGGQTKNAYGKYDVGGSSSGSGTAASAGFATFTIGTETSGSLVSPASQNGCCTIKPSLGLISRDRIIPIIERQDTAGPITRNMTDLAIALNTLSGIDENDPQTQKTASLAEVDFTQYLDADALRGKRIGVIQRDSDIKDGDLAILDKTAKVLEDAGATVIRRQWLNANFMLWSYFYGMNQGVNDYLEAIGDNRTLADLVAFNAEDEANRAPFGQGLLHLASITPLTPEMQKAYERIHHTNYAETSHALYKAMREHQLDALVDINNYSTYAYAVTGFPAVSIPAGYLPHGEPVSVTFYADFLKDSELIAMGYAYEQLTMARKPPVLIRPSERDVLSE